MCVYVCVHMFMGVGGGGGGVIEGLCVHDSIYNIMCVCVYDHSDSMCVCVCNFVGLLTS